MVFVLIFAAGFAAALLWESCRRQPQPPRLAGHSAPGRSAPRRHVPAAPHSSASRAGIALTPGPPTPSGARLAIVIDDLGNDPAVVPRLCALAEPISGAVLPELDGSRKTAEELERCGKEVLLHLPLEPLGSPNPGPGLIRSSMGGAEVAALLEKDLSDVPGARGVNNHMGSKGTADPHLMGVLMPLLRQRGLYFLDSRTSAWTVASSVARRDGVATVSRDVFLDDVAAAGAIESQLAQAVAEARKKGYAVAIGHPHPATLAVLAEELPGMARRGVTLVRVSELLALP